MSEDELVSLPKFLDDMDMPDCAAAVRQLIADARRYRWLRDVGDATWRPFGIRVGYSAAQADAAIDAAIEAMQEKGE